MADQQRPGEAAGTGVIDDDELALEVPDRGSADELLDAGAHAPLDLMRHSAAHVMAEAVLGLFPGTDCEEALRRMETAAQFGKIVLTMA